MRKLALVLSVLASPALATGIDITVAGPDGDKGVIKIDLLEDIAPKHVEQITGLAAEGAYDGVVFHRVIDGFMAQTGDVQFGNVDGETFSMRMAGMGGSDRSDIVAEFSDVPFDRGVVGMARSQSPDSANSQFFIMFEPGHFLNGQYTVVGRVTEGMEIVDGIKRGEGRNGEVYGEPDRMSKVVVTE
ncbi:peptidylprolyl isomerase [Tropicibacter naphthalenivorans]|uniref:Peptidyl-prolyl cis-trans isomerase n=1 Tax=Tropicibacter naphthalenivorans TaxID=441103 RepID=A0A0P1GG70_9RHOB|nr:peptidylprolyl isomerase [Tropicibacter naphthalenivorans]CUH80220.1 Peptidyl-prolyl cis-trans isomerase cyp18 [Tropicibacter naphthalenivorans]SMC85575.1 peptidylprolyl isomerase [Tropicibacter naphthalenivorans]